MRRNRLFWLLGAALATGLAVAAACDDDGGPGGDGEITLDEYDEAYIEALCSAVARCPAMGGDDLYFIVGGATDASACVSRMRQALATGTVSMGALFQAAVDRGSGTWDGALAADCFQLIRNAPCDDFISGALDVEHQECAEMFHGNVAAGAACYLNIDCADGWCDTSSACPGTCVAYAAPGAACGAAAGGSRCGPGYDCGDADTCVASTVVTMLDVGQACGDPDTECRHGLYCDERTSSCRAYLGAGAACGEGTAECMPGMVCHPTDAVCSPVQFSATAGTPCGEGTTTLCDTLQNLFCHPSTRQCTRAPGDGEACLSLGLYNLCGVGLYCGADSVCHAKLADGAACEDDSWCRSGECRGTCRPLRESCDITDIF
ncbi:MAG: hypothetical protein GYA57_05850 [Myxococcales bacterium]|nr:hypothetical protein [Myxococcales bacterium]